MRPVAGFPGTVIYFIEKLFRDIKIMQFSKTIKLPENVNVEDISIIYPIAWKYNLKESQSSDIEVKTGKYFKNTISIQEVFVELNKRPPSIAWVDPVIYLLLSEARK